MTDYADMAKAARGMTDAELDQLRVHAPRTCDDLAPLDDSERRERARVPSLLGIGAVLVIVLVASLP